MATPRPLYRAADLARLLNPRSIAIIGASTRAGSFGERTQRNLAALRGRVHPVNARYETLGGQPCYPSDRRAAGSAGLRRGRRADGGGGGDGAGLRGGRRRRRHRLRRRLSPRPARRTASPCRHRLAAIAREGGMRLVGPNCIGMLDYADAAPPSASPRCRGRRCRPDRPPSGIVSQSGALGLALAQGVERGVAISHVLTCGNSCDVDVADCVAYLAEDPACAAIACVFEGMADPSGCSQAAEIAWAADKPLVIYKLATGEQGAAAAMSHTGSLAGSDAAYRAAFGRAGVVLVDDFEALMETAAFFAKAPRAEGARRRGGRHLGRRRRSWRPTRRKQHGVPLPQPGAGGEGGAGRAHPGVRLGAQSVRHHRAGAERPGVAARLRRCAAAPIRPTARWCCRTAMPTTSPRRASPLLGELAAQHGKTACVVWLTEWLEGPGAQEAEAQSAGRAVPLDGPLLRGAGRLARRARRGARRGPGRDRAAGAHRTPRRRPRAARCRRRHAR